ncbi:hypothetical protein [Methylibium petroleiphilum]|uniref:Phosphoribosylanthranilate isomerase n=1 Tax=Methylibium petroleiphilum (strain ATCC BAA-1232 / LMG 22953 / PM1) TaxID=420662 RepID=A2SPA9_METPP|nr:hypothetical protein [Methylibium petroleiphilum]ABM97398.1 hypothetical protein Mpe_B0634 [Methylibium petroleiphilum PM1]
MAPQLITLTGADERTDIDALVELVRTNPLVEIGLLYTATPEGRPRYPSRAWLREAAAALSGRCAIHVCGGGARRELLAGELGDLTRHAPRVQLNGILTLDVATEACRFADTLITQHHELNQQLLGVPARNHALLVDGSGGQGIAPAAWMAPDTEKPVGFAGGLGPQTLADQLSAISAVANDGAWVDMEGKLRVKDWFSVEFARECADIFASATTSPTPVTRPRRRP